MLYNNKFDENVSKTLIKRNMLTTDPNKKIIINDNKFKTSNLVINKIFFSSGICKTKKKTL